MAFYNLDMIISLGYRINSRVATRFRQWATVRLREQGDRGRGIGVTSQHSTN